MTDPKFTPEQLQATASSAVSAVEAATGNAPSLIDAWVKAENAAAVLSVAEQGTGPARKAAKRGLSVLRSRGVKIPERGHTARIGGGPSVVEAELYAPDPSGVRVVVLKQKKPGGRVRATLVYLRDGHGVYRVETSETTSAKLRSRLKQQSSGASAVPVPVEWARYKVAAARDAHKLRRVPEPLGFGAAKAVLDPVPDTAPEHPFDAEGFTLSDEDAKALAQNSAQLHNLPEFIAWMPPPANMQAMMVEVGKKVTPGEKPDQEALAEYIKEEVRNATDRYFTEEVRKDVVERMKDAGLASYQRDGEPVALQIVAAIHAITTAGLITDPPRDIPFLTAFFEKALAIALRQNQGRLNIPTSGSTTGSTSS